MLASLQLRTLAAILAVAFALAACGSDGQTETAETTVADPEPTEAVVSDADDDASTEEAVQADDHDDDSEAVDEDDRSHDDEDEAADEDDHSHDDEDEAADEDDHSHDDETTHSHDGDVDLTFFMDGAFTTEPTIDECALTDGTVTECYTITVVGTPVNHDVGPFCPTNISDGADAGGLWLDGENSYVIDGQFFTELAGIYGDELWNNIVNEDGSINVIDNADEFQVAARPDITEEYYYHCVDGDVAWLTAGAQPTTTIQIPVTPVLADAATVQFATGAHSNLGVTFNGAALSGSADMTAILASYTIAAFDDCGGHINPALGYHVHGTAGCSDVGASTGTETAPFAIALDGHTVHAPYEDGVDVELDECNGHTSDEFGYHYHANSLEENATLTCLMGLTVEGQNAGGGPGGGGERPEGGRPPRDG